MPHGQITEWVQPVLEYVLGMSTRVVLLAISPKTYQFARLKWEFMIDREELLLFQRIKTMILIILARKVF